MNESEVVTLTEERDTLARDNGRLRERIAELRGNLEIMRNQGRLYKSVDDTFYGTLADKALLADDALKD